MVQSPVAHLLEEIERSGSGSAAFWELFWRALSGLTGDEPRRVMTAEGHRSVSHRLGIPFRSARAGGDDQKTPR